jgi:uncharacterized protein (TIGR03066 family)
MKNSKLVKSVFVSAMLFCLVGCSSIKQEPKVEINHKIVGKWSSKNIAGTNLTTNFMKDGTMTLSRDGKELSSGQYRLIDEKTLETETKQGAKSSSAIEFTDNDNTMLLTDFTKQKTPYTRL